MSHKPPAVHKEFAQKFCERTRENVNAAMKELECFLPENPDFNRSDIAVVEVEKQLDLLADNADC